MLLCGTGQFVRKVLEFLASVLDGEPFTQCLRCLWARQARIILLPTLTMRVELESIGTMAVATADAARGWRRLRNTFGFCEESRLELMGDEGLRTLSSL